MGESKAELYNDMKKNIWFLNFNGTSFSEGLKKKKTVLNFNGFTVAKKGCDGIFIMTAAHGWSPEHERVKIMGRRLDSTVFCNLVIEEINRNWDVALLKVKDDSTEIIDDLKNCRALEFVKDGLLKEGDKLMTLGNIYEFVGSFLQGFVCFSCRDNVAIPKSSSPCEKFSSYESLTPEYRKMGDIWNTKFFEDNEGPLVAFEKQLEAEVQIIQISQMCCCTLTAAGAPIFDYSGKIVGMFVKKFGEFDICVHVSFLRQILESDENLQKKQKVANQ